jgi:hypothetical protein
MYLGCEVQFIQEQTERFEGYWELETTLVMPFLSSLARNRLFFVLALTAASIPSTMLSQTAELDPLTGVWGAEVRFGMSVQGELTLDGREGVWRASIAGFQVAVETNGGDIQFKLPGNLGELRGNRDTASNTVRGEWIQPGGEILDPQYASPIEFHSISPSVWHGIVVPLDQRVSVYIFISSRDGKMTATISNPESNFFRRRVYTVARDGAKVYLEANGKKIDGTIDEKNGTLSLQLVNWLPRFQFSHRTANDAVGYYPRTPSDSNAWSYRKPIPDNDGWATASLQAEGLAEARIAELVHRILSADPAGTSIKIQSLLIARHGHFGAGRIPLRVRQGQSPRYALCGQDVCSGFGGAGETARSEADTSNAHLSALRGIQVVREL